MEVSLKRKASDEEPTSEQKRLTKCYELVFKMPFEQKLWISIMQFTNMLPIEVARPSYERVIEIFPSLSRYWKFYINHEMKEKQYEIVEKLFQRCLIKTLDIELFEKYVNYIRESKSDLNSFREKMALAYDFTLEKMGFHKLSYPFWVQYIDFLKSVTAVGVYAENQRITAIRKIYQRGIINPMKNLDLLWNDYIEFEKSINPLIARKMQEDKFNEYLNARNVYFEYCDLIRDIDTKMVVRKPGTFDRQIHQKKLWLKFIEWEKANPLKTTQVIVTRRVMYAYEQCILCLGLHDEIIMGQIVYIQDVCTELCSMKDLYNFSMFIEELERIFERAINGWMAGNAIIYYMFAEYAEKLHKYDLVGDIYKSLISIQKNPTLTYIHYMNFSKRVEDISKYRTIFKIARHDKRCSHHVYIFSAYMELYNRKDKHVAIKIFDLGLKSYPNDLNFIHHYLNFLVNMNDNAMTRDLFERCINNENFTHDQRITLWNNYSLVESIIGNNESVQKLESRKDQFLNKDTDASDDYTLLQVERYSYHGLIPVSNEQLTSMYHRNSKMFGDKIKKVDPLKDTMFRPDFSAMRPFLSGQDDPIKDSVLAEVRSLHQPTPSITIQSFINSLPPASEYDGPLVDIEALLVILLSFNENNHQFNYKNVKGPIDAGTQYSIDIANGVIPRPTPQE